MRALDVVESSGATAVALMTTLMVEDEIRQRYYKGEAKASPWGGAEAILTYTTTNFYPFTSAHAPLLLEWEHTGFGKLVDPRDGAELISSAYLCSPLKGLINSPRPVPVDQPLPSRKSATWGGKYLGSGDARNHCGEYSVFCQFGPKYSDYSGKKSNPVRYYARAVED